MPANEWHGVVDSFNATASHYPANELVHTLFEAQVARSPDTIAIVDGDHELSYAQLNCRANQLARYLLSGGVGFGEYIPIVMSRGTALIIAELSVLKIGCTYVPIDPETPQSRRDFMIHDCGAKRVLSAQAMLDANRYSDGTLSEQELPGGASSQLASPTSTPAYVMYTSGSTGEPKGVVVPHQAIKRLVLNARYVPFDSGETYAHCSNPAFDASTFEIWGALLNKGRLIIIPQAAVLDPALLNQHLKQQGVTTLLLMTALFNQHASADIQTFNEVKHLLFGGEVCDPSIVRRVVDAGRGRQRLLHVYGPTESTTFASAHQIEVVGEGLQAVPIGSPIANTRIYILDAHGEPVPIGVEGEISIGGAGVALGYLNRGELTATRFIADRFSGDAGARLYKSGDIGRWREDGAIVYVGRNDQQVKIRGFRIELGEIEAQLALHKQVREVTVIARADAGGEKRLVAYVTLCEPRSLDPESLQTYAETVLPQYMVPNAYVILQNLPLTPNGKVNRRALPLPIESASPLEGFQVPQGSTEEMLAEIWQKLLVVRRVGRHDDFFQLGGSSLSAIRLIVQLAQTCEIQVPVHSIFRNSRLAQLAQHIDTKLSEKATQVHSSDGLEEHIL
jgi:amino acid adenylation domain-containing protein